MHRKQDIRILVKLDELGLCEDDDQSDLDTNPEMAYNEDAARLADSEW